MTSTQQPAGNAKKKRSILGTIVMLAVTALTVALAGCAGSGTSPAAAKSAVPTATSTSPTSSPATSSAMAVATANLAPANGDQGYSTVNDLYRDVLNHGVACGNVVTMTSPAPASQEATCDLVDAAGNASGRTLTLQLWGSLDAANQGTSQTIVKLPDGTPYCLTIGRGAAANWSVWSNTDFTTCKALVTGLGGRWYDSNGDGDTAGTGATDTGSSPPAAPTTEATPPAPVYTASQQQALREAQEYLSMGQGFSRQGLIDQLDSPYGGKFPVADATWAADNVGADWNAEAVKAAQGYLQMQPFSHAALVAQLDSPYGGKFTRAQAEYGASQAGD